MPSPTVLVLLLHASLCNPDDFSSKSVDCEASIRLALYHSIIVVERQIVFRTCNALQCNAYADVIF